MATSKTFSLSLHDALPISRGPTPRAPTRHWRPRPRVRLPPARSEEHTSELQSLRHLVCRLLLEKKKRLYDKHYGAVIGELAAGTRHLGRGALKQRAGDDDV